MIIVVIIVIIVIVIVIIIAVVAVVVVAGAAAREIRGFSSQVSRCQSVGRVAPLTMDGSSPQKHAFLLNFARRIDSFSQ